MSKQLTKKLLAACIACTLLLGVCVGALAQEEAQPTLKAPLLVGEKLGVYIPDANFQAAIVSKVATKYNDEIGLTQADIDAIENCKTLQMGSSKISSIVGISYFKSVTSANFFNNELTSLPEELLELSGQVTMLWFSYNDLTQKDWAIIREFTNLVHLAIGGNNFTSIKGVENMPLGEGNLHQGAYWGNGITDVSGLGYRVTDYGLQVQCSYQTVYMDEAIQVPNGATSATLDLNDFTFVDFVKSSEALHVVNGPYKYILHTASEAERQLLTASNPDNVPVSLTDTVTVTFDADATECYLQLASVGNKGVFPNNLFPVGDFDVTYVVPIERTGGGLTDVDITPIPLAAPEEEIPLGPPITGDATPFGGLALIALAIAAYIAVGYSKQRV